MTDEHPELSKRIAWCDKFKLDKDARIEVKLPGNYSNLITRSQRLLASTRLMEAVESLKIERDGATVVAYIALDEHDVFQHYALNVWQGYT